MRAEQLTIDFQATNCAKGCRFTDSKRVGTGNPSCTYGGRLVVVGNVCYSRVTKGEDPTFTCRVCQRIVRYSDVPNSVDGGNKDTLYEARVCNWECNRRLS